MISNKTVLAIFQFILVLTMSDTVTVDVDPKTIWPYCDDWNKCSESSHCWNNRCVPWTCVDTTNCANGFFCQISRCVSYTQLPAIGVYCDEYTPCKKDYQCYQRKCVPLSCEYNTDCVEGFICNPDSVCFGLNYTGSVLGYCDEWTKCSKTHQCV